MIRNPSLLRMLLLPALLLAAAAAQAGPESDALFNAEGYRQAHYRSPTPASVDGAVTVDTDTLQRLLKERPDTLLIDVYRRQWLFDRFIPDEDHHNLAGSHWLANTGDGQLAPRWADYFEFHLARLSQGRQDRPMVFYCRSDCWLGWNAARRAARLGYTHLYWYRDGIDAWQQADLPLQQAEPAPMPERQVSTDR